MTTITELAELNRLPEGSVITLADTPRGQSQTWTKVGTTDFAHNGTTLSSTRFRSAVTEGKITIGSPLATGQTWDDGTWRWHICADERQPDGTRRYFALVTYLWNFDRVEWITDARGSLVTEDDLDEAMLRPLNTTVHSLGRAMWQQQRNAGAVARSQQAMGAELIEWMDDHLDDNRASFIRILQSYGIDTPARDVNVRITVSGTNACYRADMEDMDLPSDVVVDDTDGSISVMWHTTIDTTIEYDGAETDACEDRDFFGDEWAADWITENLGGEVDRYSISIDERHCSDC